MIKRQVHLTSICVQSASRQYNFSTGPNISLPQMQRKRSRNPPIEQQSSPCQVMRARNQSSVWLAAPCDGCPPSPTRAILLRGQGVWQREPCLPQPFSCLPHRWCRYLEETWPVCLCPFVRRQCIAPQSRSLRSPWRTSDLSRGKLRSMVRECKYMLNCLDIDYGDHHNTSCHKHINWGALAATITSGYCTKMETL